MFVFRVKLHEPDLFNFYHSTCKGMPCVLPRESESVLLGAAILGACASGYYETVQVCAAVLSY